MNTVLVRSCVLLVLSRGSLPDLGVIRFLIELEFPKEENGPVRAINQRPLKIPNRILPKMFQRLGNN